MHIHQLKLYNFCSPILISDRAFAKIQKCLLEAIAISRFLLLRSALCTGLTGVSGADQNILRRMLKVDKLDHIHIISHVFRHICTDSIGQQHGRSPTDTWVVRREGQGECLLSCTRFYPQVDWTQPLKEWIPCATGRSSIGGPPAFIHRRLCYCNLLGFTNCFLCPVDLLRQSNSDGNMKWYTNG